MPDKSVGYLHLKLKLYRQTQRHPRIVQKTLGATHAWDQKKQGESRIASFITRVTVGTMRQIICVRRAFAKRGNRLKTFNSSYRFTLSNEEDKPWVDAEEPMGTHVLRTSLNNGALTVKNSDNIDGKNIDAGLKSVGLTSREIQILRHLALGKGDKQISIDLLISVKTVNHHVSNIILKLDATNRTHAVAKALLAKQIEMRTTDAPIRIFNRRLGDQNKMVQAVVANNMPLSVGYQMLVHVEDTLPWHTDLIKSESAI